MAEILAQVRRAVKISVCPISNKPREWIGQASRWRSSPAPVSRRKAAFPTFRGAGGLWNDYKPEDLATPEAFARDPKLVWEWYDWRREPIAKAVPNAAHKALVQLEIRKRASR